MAQLKRTRVMNDDVLELILNYLDIISKFRVQSVSKQFECCVNQSLKRHKALYIGKNSKRVCLWCDHRNSSQIDGDITKAVTVVGLDGTTIFSAKAFQQRLKPILQKCSFVRCLYLKACQFSPYLAKLISENCKNLICLTLDSMRYPCIEETRQMAQMVSNKLKHLSVRINDNCAQIAVFIKNLESLENLSITNKAHTDLSIYNSLPQTIRVLSLNSSSNLALNALTEGNGKNITELEIMNRHPFGNEQFIILCNNLNLNKLTLLLKFKHELSELSAIANLSVLSRLTTNIVFQTKLERLRTLELFKATLTSNNLSSIDKNYPNLKKLILNRITIDCSCNNFNIIVNTYCDTCLNECFHFLSTLPSLTVLSVDFSNTFSNKQTFIRSLSEYINLRTLIVKNLPHKYRYALLKECNAIAMNNCNEKFTIKVKNPKAFNDILPYTKIKIAENLKIVRQFRYYDYKHTPLYMFCK